MRRSSGEQHGGAPVEVDALEDEFRQFAVVGSTQEKIIEVGAKRLSDDGLRGWKSGLHRSHPALEVIPDVRTEVDGKV
jgi:hypothetical protein